MRPKFTVLALALVALCFAFFATTTTACDGCLALKARNTVANVVAVPVQIAVAPVRVVAPLFAPRTVQVTVPVAEVDACGQVTACGTSTACVTARVLPRLKALRLANGKAVTAIASARVTSTTATSLLYVAPEVMTAPATPQGEPTPAPAPSVIEGESIPDQTAPPAPEPDLLTYNL